MEKDKDILKNLLQSKFEDDTVQPSKQLFDSIYEGVKEHNPKTKRLFTAYKIAAVLITLIGLGTILVLTNKNHFSNRETIVITEENEIDSVNSRSRKLQEEIIQEKKSINQQILTYKDSTIKPEKANPNKIKEAVAAIKTKKYRSNHLSKNFVLDDESTVVLNKNSYIDFSIDNNQRIVNLKGNVFFDVKKDPNKPFVVKGIHSNIKVTGTSFVMASGKVNDQITLMEGSVDIVHPATGQKQSIVPGQSANINADGIQLIKKSPNQFAWKTGNLSYQNATLNNVIRDLEENFNLTIQIDNPDILECKYTGSFRKSTPQKVLQILEVTLKIKIEEKNDIFVFSGDGPCVN